ncbi:MAG: LysM peptidoglycan-binding domain-containing protein [Bacteroidia bacterium]
MALESLSIGGNKALAKLTIIPFALIEKQLKTTFIPAGLPFVAMYNPASFSKDNFLEFIPKSKTDKLTPQIENKGSVQASITVDLLLDATGASPGGGFVGSALSKTAKTLGGVDILVANFFATTKLPNPLTHEPNFLRMIWGAGLFFECKLKSASVKYSLFDRSGRPLRATISATFEEFATASALAKIKNFFSSPDVTKTYVVKAGDTLCNLAQKEYGDESLYLQVAEANDLKNYRKLVPGRVLIFPPVKKDEE